jgi:MFS superfamily sulfate permease-like transporter
VPHDSETGQLPGVLAVLFATPIWYANAVHFREEVAAALARRSATRVLVLDTIGMSDIDFTGSRELARALDACDRAHIRVGIARAGDHLRSSLRRSGLEARIGADHFYSTVDEAVTALGADPTSPV